MKIKQKSFIWGVALIVLLLAVALGSQMSFNDIGLDPVNIEVKDKIQEWADETTRAPKNGFEEEVEGRVPSINLQAEPVNQR